MEALRRRVVNPPNREIPITLRFPESVPEGDAELLVIVAPAEPSLPASEILAMAGTLAGSGRLGGDPEIDSGGVAVRASTAARQDPRRT